MSFRNEIYRKLIHIGSSGFPMVYYFFWNKNTFVPVMAVCLVTVVVIEVFRLKFRHLKKLYNFFFKNFLREREDDTLTGASYTLMGFFFTALIFEKSVAIFSMLLLSFGDALAALVGQKIGRKSLFGKTVEGTLTFLVVALIIAWFAPGIPRIASLVAALVATCVELLPSPLNDNLMIPLSSAVTVCFVNMML